jgi:hypothetical protein
LSQLLLSRMPLSSALLASFAKRHLLFKESDFKVFDATAQDAMVPPLSYLLCYVPPFFVTQ